MQLRKKLLPKTFMDIGAVTFLLVMTQIIYWFELFLVIPEHYADGHWWTSNIKHNLSNQPHFLTDHFSPLFGKSLIFSVFIEAFCANILYYNLFCLIDVQMKLWKKNVDFQTFADFVAKAFVLLMIPVAYWFELFVVLPNLYQVGEWMYYVHFFLGTWLLFNLIGNFVICFLLDTSIRPKFLPSEMRTNWRLCDVCQAITPPRSWHCSVCDICILKRDHHCNFTACCIGHDNHRYFMMFLLHLSVATIYASYFNVIFLWKNTLFTLAGFLKLLFPVAIFMFGGDMSMTQLYRLFCVITIIAMVAAVSLGCYHFSNVLNGQVMHERVKKITEYDLGRMANVKQVFGDRWYLTWISPFIASELPYDGVDWEVVKKSSTKSK